jgi:hypothetical protein
MPRNAAHRGIKRPSHQRYRTRGHELAAQAGEIRVLAELLRRARRYMSPVAITYHPPSGDLAKEIDIILERLKL